ncbi:MAG: hypothetical protein M1816_002916 [Peltula sp. TS41687]|nr:MAG: hypothetical protein M1816_002916 [Peltula sp. TS41687]
MPAQVAMATFIPIPVDIDVPELVESADNFQFVVRIPFQTVKNNGLENLRELIFRHVIKGGKPLVIEGIQSYLPKTVFTANWLKENLSQKEENIRNLTRQQDQRMSIGYYLEQMAKLTDQTTPATYNLDRLQRYYLKDIDCPNQWFSYLRGILPAQTLYMNESTGHTVPPNHPFASTFNGRMPAPAGDLMSSLPSPMRADNLMCYIGYEGTYTPAHREMCATLGQNLMVETSGDGLDPWGRREKPGSSLWLMTESADRFLVAEYWMSILGHDIEVESHFAQINAWKNAPFTTYVVEQKAGDLILIPPLAPHQVWNRGTRTMKVAWNRTTVDTLEMALCEALPRARMVCRDEQYKCKAIVYFTMIKYSAILNQLDKQVEGWSTAAMAEINNNRKVKDLRRDFRRLFRLYQDILLSESFSPDLPKPRTIQYLPYDSNVTCAYCRCNIFNRFLTCPTCILVPENEEEDAYDVCMDCYVMGRSCRCISNLKWVEQFHWKDLMENYERWRLQVIDMGGGDPKDSGRLDEVRKKRGRKTLAAVCQEQLKRRPWRDIDKPAPTRAEEQGRVVEDPDAEVEVDDQGRKKTKRRRFLKSVGPTTNCHICKKREPNWKLARCRCGTSYCYGVLFRAFDQMPLTVMENPHWKCPRCMGNCSCGQCRNNGGPVYIPLAALVGHDTKRVADPRSCESLVDFSHSNLSWIEKLEKQMETEGYRNMRLKRLQEEAELEKEKAHASDVSQEDDDVGLDEEVIVRHLSSRTSSARQTPGAPLQFDPALTKEAGKRRKRSAPRKSSASEAGRSRSGTVASRGQHAHRLSQVAPQSSGFEEDDEMTTELERHPDDFIANAGLSGLRRDVHMGYPVPPVANMIRPEELNPWAESSSTQAPKAASKSTTKRKRQEEASHRSENDLVAARMESANREYEQARVQKMLAEAKKNDSFTMTQARLKNQQKIVTFPMQNPQVIQAQEHLARLQAELAQSQAVLAQAYMAQEQENEQEDVEMEEPEPVARPKPKSKSKPKPKASGKRARRSHFGGDGADDDMLDDFSMVQSDYTNLFESTLPSAVIKDHSYETPPTIFSRKKRGRPSKADIAARAAQASASAKKSSEAPQATPSADVINESGPSTISRGRKGLLFSNDQQSSMGRISPSSKTVGTRQKDLGSSPTKSTLLQEENDNKDEEESAFEEVDDNYLPISKGTSTNGNASSTFNIGKVSDPYHDAKMVALRIADGEMSDPYESDELSLESASHNGLHDTITVSETYHRTTNTPKGAQEKRMLTKATLMQVEDSTKEGSGSLFSRPGMTGKKIKIVSQKNARRQTTGGAIDDLR